MERIAEVKAEIFDINKTVEKAIGKANMELQRKVGPLKLKIKELEEAANARVNKQIKGYLDRRNVLFAELETLEKK